MRQVFIPSQLQSYSAGVSRVTAAGSIADEVLHDLDARFPGIRFRVVDEQDRVRRHMRLFAGREAIRDIAAPLPEGAELMIFGALSGG